MRKLNIKPEDSSPSFGFIPQRLPVNKEWISDDMKNELKVYANSFNISYEELCKDLLTPERIITLNQFTQKVFTIHTDFLSFLVKNFSVNLDFEISQFFEYKHQPLVKDIVFNYLNQRKIIKKEIATLQNNPEKLHQLQTLSSLYKLFNNSIYGYTLLKQGNYTTSKFITNIGLKKCLTNKNNQITKTEYLLNFNLSKKVYLIDSKPLKLNYSTLHLGSCILFKSKTIFFKCILFILKHSDPTKVELTYLDTDSIHLLCFQNNLIDNMLPDMVKSFNNNVHKYFSGLPNSPIAGVLEWEGDFPAIKYRGEKIYQKLDNNTFTTICKGVPESIKRNFLENYNKDNLFNTEVKQILINWNRMQIDKDFNLYLKLESKLLKYCLIPLKRNFKGYHSICYKPE